MIASSEGQTITAIGTVSAARASLGRLIDQAAEFHQLVPISSKRSNAVLIAAEDWQAMWETLHLLGLADMRDSIKEGMAKPSSQSAAAVDWRAAKAGWSAT